MTATANSDQPLTGLTMSAAEVAATLGYLRRNGEPNREVVRKLAREGRIPPPIDFELSVVHWRWSTRLVEAYVVGEWAVRRDHLEPHAMRPTRT